jgi:endonuclease/exonuclease/phosphatase family metal-dependent hydrolase
MLAGISAPLLPIDHIFVSPDLAFGRVSTLPSTGSDHLAVRTTVWMHDRQ